MPEEDKEAGQGVSQDGSAIFDALAPKAGPIEHEQLTEQERPEIPKLFGEDVQALAQAYREAAAEMMADPLFDLDSGHGLNWDEMLLDG